MPWRAEGSVQVVRIPLLRAASVGTHRDVSSRNGSCPQPLKTLLRTAFSRWLGSLFVLLAGPSGGQPVGPAFLPVEGGIDEVLEPFAVEQALEGPPVGGVGDHEHGRVVPVGAEGAEEAAGLAEHVPVALPIRERYVKVPGSFRCEPGDGHAVEPAVVAFTQSRVEVEGDSGPGE